MNRERPNRQIVAAAALALIAGVWMILGPVLGHMGPPFPCVAAGIGILALAAVALRWPARGRGIGVLIMFIAGGLILLGPGGILPGALGVAAGLLFVVSGKIMHDQPLE